MTKKDDSVEVQMTKDKVVATINELFDGMSTWNRDAVIDELLKEFNKYVEDKDHFVAG